MKAKLWALIITLLAGVCVASAQTGAAPLDSLDLFISKTMQEWQVPGLAISIVQDGKVIFAKGYGVQDLDTKEAVSTKTLFSIASCTKAFTSTLAAMLVQDSLIDWDTPLKTYFPDFELYDPMASAKITLRDFLCHRSGIPEQEFFRMNEPSSRREVMQRMRYFEPDYDFRTVWNYNNLGYTVAGTMLELRAGMKWEDLVRKRLFEPLAMNSSLFSVENMQRTSEYARPYIVYDKETERMDFYNANILGPAGCIVSNVDDMSKWLLFQLNRGEVDGKTLIRPEILAETRRPQIPVPPRGGKEILCPAYGMGWMIDAYRGTLHIQHGGLLFGFTALVSMLPTERTGMVVLTNLNGTPLPTIIEGYIYDRLLHLSPVDWNGRKHEAYKKMEAMEKEEATKSDPDKKPDTPLSHPTRDYTGTFHNDGYGDIIIRMDGDTLRAKLTTIECPLYHYNHDKFELYHKIKRSSWLVAFNNDATGNIRSFSITIAPNVKDIVFTRKEIQDAK